jgi:hypothetical protein
MEKWACKLVVFRGTASVVHPCARDHGKNLESQGRSSKITAGTSWATDDRSSRARTSSVSWPPSGAWEAMANRATYRGPSFTRSLSSPNHPSTTRANRSPTGLGRHSKVCFGAPRTSRSSRSSSEASVRARVLTTPRSTPSSPMTCDARNQSVRPRRFTASGSDASRNCRSPWGISSDTLLRVYGAVNIHMEHKPTTDSRHANVCSARVARLRGRLGVLTGEDRYERVQRGMARKGDPSDG